VAAHKEADMKKYMADAKLIENFHEPARLKEVTLSQYLDLYTIHQAVCVEKSCKLTSTMLFKATSCVISGFYTNGKPGRSKELQTLPVETVDEFLETSPDHECIPYSNYKTEKTYGTGGKWICAGNRHSIGLYKEIMDSAPELFADVERVSPTITRYFFQKQIIAVSNCLRSVSVTEGLDPPLRVNLNRKVYAVWAKLGKTVDQGSEGADASVDKATNDLFAKVAYGGKHRVPTADKVYAAISPEQDAMIERECFHRLMGKPVEFPSHDEWKQKGRSLQEVLAKMRDGDENDDGEESSDEEISLEELARDHQDEPIDDWENIFQVHAKVDTPPLTPKGFKVAEKELEALLEAADKNIKGQRNKEKKDEKAQKGNSSSKDKKGMKEKTEVQEVIKKDKKDKKEKKEKKDKEKKDKVDKGKEDKKVRLTIDPHKEEHIDKRFVVKEPNPAMSQASETQGSTTAEELLAQLSEEDLLALRVHAMVSRGLVFEEHEKAFLIVELRKAQGNVNSMPNSCFIVATITKGEHAGMLKTTGKTEKRYYEQVLNFLKTFLRSPNLK
jgi:hypothetical protein